MGRRRRTGEVEDFVDFDVERKIHVVPDEFETMVVEKRTNVVLASSEEVVDAEHTASSLDQPLAQVRAEKPGTARHEDSPGVKFQSTDPAQ